MSIPVEYFRQRFMESKCQFDLAKNRFDNTIDPVLIELSIFEMKIAQETMNEMVNLCVMASSSKQVKGTSK